MKTIDISPIDGRFTQSVNYLQQVGINVKKFVLTLNERELRMPHIRGIKNAAVVNYCKFLITKKMGCHQLSRRVNKIEKKTKFILLP